MVCRVYLHFIVNEKNQLYGRHEVLKICWVVQQYTIFIFFYGSVLSRRVTNCLVLLQLVVKIAASEGIKRLTEVERPKLEPKAHITNHILVHNTHNVSIQITYLMVIDNIISLRAVVIFYVFSHYN